ncbi:hypothetical protein F5141DRAFT_1235547 [Pisolithus sp. B1]|nr:hypothetical protein F5141DRAFT_1235547 [Pisolithus sp. B1]
MAETFLVDLWQILLAHQYISYFPPLPQLASKANSAHNRRGLVLAISFVYGAGGCKSAQGHPVCLRVQPAQAIRIWSTYAKFVRHDSRDVNSVSTTPSQEKLLGLSNEIKRFLPPRYHRSAKIRYQIHTFSNVAMYMVSVPSSFIADRVYTGGSDLRLRASGAASAGHNYYNYLIIMGPASERVSYGSPKTEELGEADWRGPPSI